MLSHLAQHFPTSAQPKVRRVKHGLWHKLKKLHPYAFLVASVNRGGRALPIGRQVFRRDLAGEAADSQNQFIGYHKLGNRKLVCANSPRSGMLSHALPQPLEGSCETARGLREVCGSVMRTTPSGC